MVVFIAFRALAHIAGHLDHELGAQRTSHFFLINDYLDQTGSIAHIQKGDATVITTTVNPPGNGHFLANHSLCNISAMMRAISRLTHSIHTSQTLA